MTTCTIESEQVISPAAPVANPRKRRTYRRMIAAFSILCLMTGMGLLWNTPVGRLIKLRVYGLRYLVHDPVKQFIIADVGPWSLGDAETMTAENLIPEYGLGIAPQKIGFRHEPIGSPRDVRFRELTRRYWEPAETPFDLANRIREMAPHGPVTRAFVVDDPLMSFEFASTGQPVTCKHFSLLFVSLCAQKGWTARMVGLSMAGKHWDHAVAEVYWPPMKKWIMIDPDFNVGYRRGDQFLNVAEIREAWLEVKRRFQRDAESLQDFVDRLASIRPAIAQQAPFEIVAFGQASAELRQTNMLERASGLNLELFEYVIYSCRNDYLANSYPKGHPVAIWQLSLRQSSADAPPAVCPEVEIVDDPIRVYWPVGRVVATLTLTNPDGGKYAVALNTYCPNFSHFEISNNGKDWDKIEGNSINDLTFDKTSKISLRAVNRRGFAGEATDVHRPRR